MTTRSIAVLVTAVLLPGTAAAQKAPEYARAWEGANAPYKRALQATSLGKGEEGLRFLGAFRHAWQAFRTAYEAKPPAPFRRDRGWSADLRAISEWIERSDREIRAGESHAAHETLEQVRLRWLEMRARHGVSTFGDHLTRYHDPMEKVALAVKDRTAATINEADIEAIRAALPEMERLWRPIGEIVRSRRPALSSDSVAPGERRALVEAEESALRALKRAVEADDREGIVAHGAQLKPRFAKLYMQFG